MDEDFELDEADTKESLKDKQKAYRRQVYLAMKEKKREHTLKERQERKTKKAQDHEEAIRQKNARLWNSLRLGSQLGEESPGQNSAEENPFLTTDETKTLL